MRYSRGQLLAILAMFSRGVKGVKFGATGILYVWYSGVTADLQKVGTGTTTVQGFLFTIVKFGGLIHNQLKNI